VLGAGAGMVQGAHSTLTWVVSPVVEAPVRSVLWCGGGGGGGGGVCVCVCVCVCVRARAFGVRARVCVCMVS
jgi:hypothetical protein